MGTSGDYRAKGRDHAGRLVWMVEQHT